MEVRRRKRGRTELLPSDASVARVIEVPLSSQQLAAATSFFKTRNMIDLRAYNQVVLDFPAADFE